MSVLRAAYGRVLLDPIWRSDLQKQEASSKIPGFGVAEPQREGAPRSGRVIHIGGSKVAPEFAPGDTVIFCDLRPPGFRHEGRGYIVVEIEDVVAIAQEPAA